MSKRGPGGPGNGSGKVNVHARDEGGWLRVFTDPLSSVPDELPIWLSHAATAWFRQRPHLHIVAVMPVVRDGETVELHAWYTQHAFPDLSGQRPSPID